MNTLILTCNTGQGHNSSATAIQEAYLSYGQSCTITDTLSFLSKSTSQLVGTCFTGIYRHMPKAFDLGYTHTDAHIGKISASDYLVKVLQPGCKRLYRFIVDGKYTEIICVHIFSAVMLSILQQKYDFPLKTAFLSTDYTCYPFVDKTDIDFYLLPHADLADEFANNGIPKEKLITTGIPVRSAFLEKTDRQQARRILNIDENKKVIFIMGGSMGCGPIEELAIGLSDETNTDTMILVSCGTNGKLLRSLQKRSAKKITPFEYSNNVPQIMAASDLFITKPGGISITEAGVMGIPTLLIDAVGGCEPPNYKFFIEHGYAFGVDNVSTAVKTCIDLVNSPELLLSQSERSYKELYKNSAEEIYSVFAARNTKNRETDEC